MSRPSEEELALLTAVANEIREVFEERGHNVDVAMEVDPAFGSARSRSSVRRDLVVDTADRVASQIGLDFRSVNGEGREFRYVSDVARRYRLLKGRRNRDGDLVVPASSDSMLAKADDGLFDEDHWAFVWTMNPEGLIDETLVAKVLRYVEGTPGHLELGTPIAIGVREGGPSDGFWPTDEGLDGFDEDELGDTGTGSL